MNLLHSKNTKDYFVLESTFKGNFIFKNEWRQK